MAKVAPEISCIVPAYNAEAFLQRALQSVLDQSLPPDEIIVVDDGSTDATARILDGYGDRLRVLRQANRGAAAARNTGIRAARGELICFQDADDEWLPDKLAMQVQLLSERSDVDICITHLRNIWDDAISDQREALAGHAYANDPPGYVFQTSVMRANVFERAGLLNEDLRRAEDIEWFARVRDAGLRVEILPNVLVHRYLHGNNLSDRGETTATDRYDDLLEIMAARLKQRV